MDLGPIIPLCACLSYDAHVGNLVSPLVGISVGLSDIVSGLFFLNHHLSLAFVALVVF